ncbi:hypothetical protein QN348_21555, partial [Mucilaginibacter sp. 5C4]
VLYIRAVEYARRHGVTLHVRSSFNNNLGTIVYNPDTTDPATALPDGTVGTPPVTSTTESLIGEKVEEPIIAGIAADLSEAKVTVVGVPDI